MRIVVAVLAVIAVGCGGDDAKKPPIVRSQAPPAAPKVRATPARPRDVALIRRWADTLRAGHANAAADLFHLREHKAMVTAEIAAPLDF